MQNTVVDDRAGKTYWNATFYENKVSDRFDPNASGIRNYGKRELHAYFRRVLALIEPKGRRLFEIGCGRSVMLPYFSREFGFAIAGLDYSERACALAREILRHDGIDGAIYCADVFSRPADLAEQFDVVVSFGVAEHFNDTVGCIRAFSHYLKPDGYMITTIPNMTGWVGGVQRVLDRVVYEKHVPLDATTLAKAHELADLRVLECGYFLFTNFGVANLTEIRKGTAEWFIKQSVFQALRALTGATWLFESMFGSFKPNRLTSPYIRCVAQKEPEKRVAFAQADVARIAGRRPAQPRVKEES